MRLLRQLHSHSTALRRLLSTLPARSEIRPIRCSQSVEHFVDKYDTFMFDCDGVLWKSDHVTPLPGIAEAIRKLHDMNKRVIYVTNNSLVSTLTLQEKFGNYGIDASLDTIFGTASAAAFYLKHILNVKGKVYLVGGMCMKWELDQLGIYNFGAGPDTDKPSADIPDLLKMSFEENVEAVLVGFDAFMNYNKIYKAASYLTDRKCQFVATNNIEKGIFIDDEGKRKMPMAGMIVSAVAECGNRRPIVVGKPNMTMFDCIQLKHPGIDKSTSVFIGDSLKADMGFAKTVGIDSALVLSGINQMENVEELPELAPEYVMDSIADILH